MPAQEDETPGWLEQGKAEEKGAEVEEGPEASSFMIHFHPDALIYKVDANLVHALIKRGSFNGLRDGRERELGEAQITGFTIHHSDDTHESHEVEQEEASAKEAEAVSLEFSFAGHQSLARSRLPTPAVVVSASAFLMSVVVAGFAWRSRRSRVEYEQLGTEGATVEA